MRVAARLDWLSAADREKIFHANARLVYSRLGARSKNAAKAKLRSDGGAKAGKLAGMGRAAP